eukprot:c3690_g1_i1.p1 GENE.c3690_g1_i1~~c3690_g1_i1.p1  ORF type:complete len:409 (+),score=93.29 c3690_g1_i1:2-1228(+)
MKSIAQRLNMETDWNTCIVLNDQSPLPMQQQSTQAHDYYQPLPRGISAIRSHLENVDHLPLLVRLFAESSPKSVLEMTRIFQENGDVVCCVTHSHNTLSSMMMAQSNCAVHLGSQPLPGHAPVFALPCSIVLDPVGGIQAFYAIMMLCRRFGFNTQQCYALSIQLSLTLALLNFILEVLTVCPPFPILQQLWLLLVIIPILCLSMMPTRSSGQDDKFLPTKNILDLSSAPRFGVYFFLRAASVIGMTIAIYLIALSHSLELSTTADLITHNHLNLDGFKDGIEYSRNVALFFLVVYFTTQSMSFLHRTQSLYQNSPFQASVWVLAATACCFGQGMFLFASTSSHNRKLPNKWWAVASSWVFVVVILDELIKLHDVSLFHKQQRKAKFVFDTKLGMHSPVIGGQYIDEI